ncbi:nuclear transport factor 2 family protein [Marinomonas sp. 15G1-11]|uniref:Nuclear transport factor 2 family protein n=1 Tax=Marinomonas phaeophyticola TaxID=3004091 RepID=A0ABT4JUT5_9GAMM|nr:nuclear transport factor 2 family protein [Marinomonas sp. 15G1-11]MCZ2721304.1 nuclear transport factor 2 family protein [Marinomonas sp. 15G1-11]
METVSLDTASINKADKHMLIERFKHFYKDVKNPPLNEIGKVYSDNVHFKDPVHEVRGMDALYAYMEDVCHSVESGRFEYLDELIGDNRAYIKWNMYFKHPKLGNEIIVVRGMSQIQFNERIYYHEDIYDLGEMLYEHVPLVGFLVKKLKHRLSNQ